MDHKIKIKMFFKINIYVDTVNLEIKLYLFWNIYSSGMLKAESSNEKL